MDLKLIKQVFLDSEYRQSGETNSNFSYYPNDHINNVNAILVRSVEITHTFYSFKSSNNVFYYKYDTDGVNTTHSLTISTGKCYSAADFITDLNVLFVANGHASVITSSFSASTGKITISCALKIRPMTATEQPLNTSNNKLGFTDTSYIGATSHIASSILRVYPFLNIFVISNIGKQLSEHMNENLNRILCKISVDNNFGSVLKFTGDSFLDMINFSNPIFVDYIWIKLYDDDGELINLNGGEFTAQINCYSNQLNT